MLPKQSYKKSVKNAALLDTSNTSEKIKSHEKNGLPSREKSSELSASKKKSRESKERNHHDSGNYKDKSEHKKKHKNKEKTRTADTIDDVNLLGTPVKAKSSSSAAKLSKDKSSKKEKKLSKQKMMSNDENNSKSESKSEYEEALGISTPSKEIY